MRFKRIIKDVELPEKVTGGYVNVRSAERVDIRPGETRQVITGIKVYLQKGEIAGIRGAPSWVGFVTPAKVSSGDLTIMIKNATLRNLMVYCGQVIASIDIIKRPRKKTTVVSSIVDIAE